jgi:hypothetical protein
MISPPTNDFGLIITSVADGTQPTTTYGTSVTPGTSSSYGNYATVLAGASVTSDVYAIEVIVNGANVNASDRGMLVTVGFDGAGGTSFGGLGGVTGNEISNLLCSGANAFYTNGAPTGGHRFFFPLFIRAGTSIGAKAQTNSATAGTVRVSVRLWCQPSRPDLIRTGSFVRTFGANTATTDGVTVVQGTTTEGDWTSIGTAADSLWYLETGIGARSATQVDHLSLSDVSIGDASNKRTVLRDLFFLTVNSEFTHKLPGSGDYCRIASGDVIYARSQATGAQLGFSMACYGVGG